MIKAYEYKYIKSALIRLPVDIEKGETWLGTRVTAIWERPKESNNRGMMINAFKQNEANCEFLFLFFFAMHTACKTRAKAGLWWEAEISGICFLLWLSLWSTLNQFSLTDFLPLFSFEIKRQEKLNSMSTNPDTREPKAVS